MTNYRLGNIDAEQNLNIRPKNYTTYATAFNAARKLAASNPGLTFYLLSQRDDKIMFEIGTAITSDI